MYRSGGEVPVWNPGTAKQPVSHIYKIPHAIMKRMGVSWQLVTAIALFGWHEFEEYRILLPWLERNRGQLPHLVRKLHLSKTGFIIIAAEELVLFVLIALLFSPVWFAGAIIAYGLHLVAHCGQMIYTRIQRLPLDLWSAPIQLPICVLLLATMPKGGGVSLQVAGAVMTGVMVANLALMHALTHRIRHR